MSDSLQKWVGRNRPPRVQITYDVETGDAVEKKELPLVVGLMADLSGKPLNPPVKLKERRFVEIDRDNFNEIMGKIAPRLDMSVPDTLKGEGNLKVELNFTEFDHFHPEAIVRQGRDSRVCSRRGSSCATCWPSSMATMNSTRCSRTSSTAAKTCRHCVDLRRPEPDAVMPTPDLIQTPLTQPAKGTFSHVH